MLKIFFPPEFVFCVFFLRNFKSYFIVILNYLETFKILQFLELINFKVIYSIYVLFKCYIKKHLLHNTYATF